jgi:hypothetical protein
MLRIDELRKTNEMSEILHFVGTWVSEHLVTEPSDVSYQTSRFGNINTDGSAFSGYARTLTMQNPLFYSLIEPAVRPLVAVCVKDLGLVTYTSCEGHAYPDRHLNSELHVGILPRSTAEHQLVLEVFGAVCQHVKSRTVAGQFSLATGEVTDRESGEKWPAIDLYLISRGTWDDYYEHRGGNVSQLIDALQSLIADCIRGQ